MDERPQIEVVTESASRIINSMQNAIFSALQAASSSVHSQMQLAAAFQRLESKESIIDWLVQRRIDQEKKLVEAELRPAQKAMIDYKIQQIDEEMSAMLRSSGIDDQVATMAVKTVVDRKRVPKGQDGAGQYLPTTG